MDDHTVTGRVVALLDAVAALGDSATLAELTRGTGIPKPTVRRIAEDLVRRGLLDRGEDGYRLGTRLVELGVRAAEQQDLHHAITPHAQDLFARSGEIVCGGAFTDSAVTVIDTVFGFNRAVDMRRGSWPTRFDHPGFLATAVGRLVLADRPDLFARLTSRPLTPFTRDTTTSCAHLRSALDVVRDTGVAVEHNQVMSGFSCVAVGVRGTDRSLAGFVAVICRNGTFAPHRLVRPLLDAAADIDRLLAVKRRAPAVRL